MNAQELATHRQEKDNFFRTHPQSPLPREERASFEGLQYYPYNEALDLVVEVEELDPKSEIQMETSSGDLRDFQRWGQFTFEVEGQQARLTIYYSPYNGYFFLPFTDATSGKETYGAGRYLDIEAVGGNKFAVDFNLAYNPYCAVSPNFSCPFPPAENRLSVPIRAGEKYESK